MTKANKRPDPYVAPPPTSGETFGNVRVSQLRHVDGRSNRVKKTQEQFNTKVETGFGDKVDDVRRQLEAEIGRDIARGEFLAMMLAAFVANRGKEDLGKALQGLRAPLPNADDLAADRKQPMNFFATRPMERALKERTQNLNWTLGGVIEDLLVKASRAVQPEGKR